MFVMRQALLLLRYVLAHGLCADIDLRAARGVLRGFGGVLHLAQVGGFCLLQHGRRMACGRLDNALVRLLEGGRADLRVVAEGRGLGDGVRGARGA